MTASAARSTPPRTLGPAERRRVVDAELRELFGRRRTSRQDLPDPRPRAAAAIRALLEVLAGDRPARQLAGWVSPRILFWLENRSPTQRGPGSREVRLRSLHLSEPAESVVEVTAVIHDGPRCRAVALRMEGIDGRWTVTALRVG